MKTDQIKKEEQIRKLKTIILAGEKERDDFAYELHEDLCQMLAASLLYIQLAKKNITGAELTYIEEAGNLLDDVVAGVRSVAKNLYPITLKSLGLVNLFHELSNLISEQKEVECIVSIDESCIKTSPVNYQHILYQIAQLQVINIIKCDEVSKVEINILPFAGKIKMTIWDDAFFKNERNHINSAGFKTLTDFIEAFDGNFNFKFHNNTPGMEIEVCI